MYSLSLIKLPLEIILELSITMLYMYKKNRGAFKIFDVWGRGKFYLLEM